MYEKLDLPIIESRLDWITATADLDHNPDVLRHHGELRVADYERDGYKPEPWRFQGYAGVKCGNWRVGYGKNGTIAVVTGVEAEEEAYLLARYSSHWSRVDYCTTVHDASARINPALDYWAEWPTRNLPANRHSALSRLQTYLGGTSVTLGRRASAYFTRVYDKTAESDGQYPNRCWRYEVELKRHASEMEHLRWRSGYPPVTHASAMCAAQLAKHYLPTPWKPGSPVRQAVEIKRVTDLQRTLKWLETQVRPSVEWAAQLAGEYDVLQALGLPHVAYKYAEDQ